MSWFARSLANAFAPEPDESSSTSTTAATAAPAVDGAEGLEIMSPRGVKEDLSEITKTLTRQLWGVASFLAPPPESPSPESGSSPSSMAAGSHHSDLVKSDKDEEEEGDLPGFAGIRSDFAEIGGRFKSGISKLSNNKAVSEISKIATSFLPFGAEEEEEEEELEEDRGSTEGAIGITEEVLTFARNISMHPETWLDFPLLPEEEDSDDFDMSDAQHDHALAVEHLAPRLAALRIELCPSHMSEGCFWKIYFVLLHPRLNKEDAERLSTPQIVEARAMLLQELQNRTSELQKKSVSTSSYRKEFATSTANDEEITPSSGYREDSAFKTMAPEEPGSFYTDSETEKHPVITTEIKIVDKSVVKEEFQYQPKSSSSDGSRVPIQRFEDEGDDWLEDEGMNVGISIITNIPLGTEEDVSFSDLEDEDDRVTPAGGSQKEIHSFSSKTKDSKDWVELSKGSGNFPKEGKAASSENESNEWLDIEDIDLA